MSNRVKESDIPEANVNIPELSPNEQEAMVVLVHRYTVRCCAGTSRITVEGYRHSEKSWRKELGPLEDFICWRVEPGRLYLSAEDYYSQSAHADFEVMVNKDETLYLAVDTDMREPPPYELSFQVLSEKTGLHHVYQTLKRIREFNTVGPSEEAIKRIEANSEIRVQEKLACIDG